MPYSVPGSGETLDEWFERVDVVPIVELDYSLVDKPHEDSGDHEIHMTSPSEHILVAYDYDLIR
jgi:hypothetical protein